MVLGLALGPAQGQGTLIVQHSGYNNPITEGFSGGGLVGGVTNDLGYDAWFTTCQYLNSASGYSYYGNDLTGLSWELSIVMRVVTTNVQAGRFSATFDTGSEGFLFEFGSLTNGDPELELAGASYSPVYILNGAGSTYNTYQLLYDAASDTASLWINGAEQLGDIVGYGTSHQPLLSWGGGYQGPGSIQANWNLVSLEVIPEPSSLCLLGLGGLVCALFFRKRQPTTFTSTPSRLTMITQMKTLDS